MQTDREIKQQVNMVIYEFILNATEMGVAATIENLLNEYYNDLVKILKDRVAIWQVKRINAAKEAPKVRLKNNRKLMNAGIANNSFK